MLVSVRRELTTDPLNNFTLYPPLAGRNLKITLCDSGSQHFRPAVPEQRGPQQTSNIQPKHTLLGIGAVSLFGYGWRRKRTVVSLGDV